MTKAELLAAADALDKQVLQYDGVATEHISVDRVIVRMEIERDELRAQAAAAGASMTEPKRIEDALKGYTGPKDAVFSLRSRIDADCEFCGTKPHKPCQHTPNEAFDHPAPAPADHPLFGKMEQLGQPFEKVLHGNLDALQEAEHPAPAPAEPDVASPEYWDKLGAAVKAAPRLPDQDISKDPPPFPEDAGVPDVDGLIKELNIDCKWFRRATGYESVAARIDQSARFLAALQSHSKAIDAEYAFARKRLLALAGEIAIKERENAQQAERIKELEAELNSEGTRSVELLRRSRKAEAKLAEAVEVFRWLNMRGGLGLDVHERISIAIAKAREVMG